MCPQKAWAATPRFMLAQGATPWNPRCGGSAPTPPAGCSPRSRTGRRRLMFWGSAPCPRLGWPPFGSSGTSRAKLLRGLRPLGWGFAPRPRLGWPPLAGAGSPNLRLACGLRPLGWGSAPRPRPLWSPFACTGLSDGRLACGLRRGVGLRGVAGARRGCSLPRWHGFIFAGGGGCGQGFRTARSGGGARLSCRRRVGVGRGGCLGGRPSAGHGRCRWP